MNLQKIQSFARVLQSYSTLCTENCTVMSVFVNCDIIHIISIVISVVICPRVCSICPSSLWDQA